MSVVMVYNRPRPLSHVFESAVGRPPSTATVLKIELGSIESRATAAALAQGPEFGDLVEDAVRHAIESRDLHVALEIVQGLATMRAGAALFPARSDLAACVLVGARGAAWSVLAAQKSVGQDLDDAIMRAQKIDTELARGFVSRSHAHRAAMAHDAMALEEALAAATTSAASLRSLIALLREAIIGLMTIMVS